MTTTAYIADDFSLMAVRIALVRENSVTGEKHVGRIDNGHLWEWREAERYAQIEPTLLLCHEEAIALASGLADHFDRKRADRHLTTAELAERVTVDEGQVADWRDDGTGPRFFRIGKGEYRYRLADVLAWEESKIEPRPEPTAT